MRIRILAALFAIIFGSQALAQVTPGTSPLSLSKGGTGQSSRTSAINALLPTPTRAGDVVYWNGSQWVTLAGNNSGTLCMSENGSGAPSWIICGSLIVGTSPIASGTTGRPLYDNGGFLGEYAQVPTGFGGTGADNSTNTQGDILSSSSNNGSFATRSLNALCTLAPSVCNLALGYTSIAWYGAKCDGIFQSNQNFDKPATNISITSGTPLLTSSGSTFTSADVGKRIYVPGAGAAGAGLSTTIASFVGATQVNLAVNASTTVTAVAATNAAPFAYGTDDTTAIQSAMTAAGNTRSALYIPGSNTGCVIRQQGANTYSLLQNKPFSIRGDGHFSNLMTFPDIPSTVDNLFVDGTGGWDWTGISWSNFSIGMSPSFIPPTFIMYKRYGKRGLVLSDSAAANFVGPNITNLMIGESGNDHSLYIGNGTSSPSQGVNILSNKIYGGIHLANVSDSFRVQNNFLYGASTLGSLFEFVAGADGFNFSNNNVTQAGCTVVESGTKPVFAFNYFEEVVNASSCARNAIVDFNGGIGTVIMPSFYSNTVNAGVSTTATPVRYNNVIGGAFGDNFMSTSTSRTFVTSVTTMNCSYAPNSWNGGGTHFSTALANTIGGC